MKGTVLENIIVLISKNVLILNLRPYFIIFLAIMFSHVSAQWTDERNIVHERTIKYLLQVKVNIDHSCLQMHRVISTNQELIQNIVSG